MELPCEPTEQPMKLKAVLPLILILSSAACFAQTFMIVATEIRDGEELSRPFPSQEGMIEGMFDLGFVSFDTGLYAPVVDWESLDFSEPLFIARQGLAQYLLTAEVRSTTEARDLSNVKKYTGESPAQGLLKIQTSVRYYLYDVRSPTPIGQGVRSFDNEGPETLELTYSEFLHGVGRDIAGLAVDLMRKTAEKR
jgi:hypothetical protein